jgi:nucleoside-diphosphate-sugar epimerase
VSDGRRFLVTGGSGGLGQAVCAELLGRGAEVVVYDSRAVPGPLADHPALHWEQGDLRDRHHLPRVIKEQRTQVIVHLAAMLGIPTDADPATGVDVNCGGMTNVLESARLMETEKVVWASTVGLFSGLSRRGAEVIENDSPYAPSNVYDATKILCEVLARHYANRFGVNVVGLRWPFMISLRSLGIAAHIATQLVVNPVRGVPGVVPGGDDVPNWLWVGDAARAVAMAADAETVPGLAYNVCGDIRPFREAVDIMRRLVPGADLSLEPGEIGFRYPVATDLLERDIGFTPEWKLEDQLEALVAQASEMVGNEQGVTT